MTTDDRDLEAAMAGLRTTGAAHASPRTSWPRSAWPIGTPASTRRSDRWSWPGTGWACRAVEAADDDATFEATHAARTGRPSASGAEALPGPARARPSRRRLAGDRRVRIDLDLRGHTDFERDVWHKALEIPRGEVRPYGWVAAEIGRPEAVRAVGTALGHNPVPLIVPCHRVVRTGRHDRPVLAGRAREQADDPGGRGPRSGPRWRRPRGSRRPARRLATRPGSSACRRAGTPGGSQARAPASRSARSGRGRRAATGRARSAARRPRAARRLSGRLDRSATGRRTAVLTPDLGPLAYANRPPTTAPEAGRRSGLGMLVLYVVWGSTYLGIAIAVDTIPPFLMAATRFLVAGLVLLAWSVARDAVGVRRPDPARVARQRHRRRAAARRRDGHGRLRGADRPVGHHGAAHRDDAGLGRHPRRHLPRRTTAAPGRRRDRASGFVGVAILVGPSAFGGAGALEPLGLAALLLSPIAWSAGSLFASHRAVLPASRSWRPAPRC